MVHHIIINAIINGQRQGFNRNEEPKQNVKNPQKLIGSKPVQSQQTGKLLESRISRNLWLFLKQILCVSDSKKRSTQM